MRNKIFTKIIITTLLITFLTLNVGKVTRVSAVGTTIAGAAAATLCAVGIVYCSYMILTGAAVNVPSSDGIQDWLTDMGTKVVQYPAGRSAYNELYPQLINVGDEPLTSILDRAWTWTYDKLKSWSNSFSDTRIIEGIASYVDTLDYDPPTTNFDYSLQFQAYLEGEFSGDTFVPVTLTNTFSGHRVILNYYDTLVGPATIANTNITEPVRNLYIPDDGYYAQVFRNGDWQTLDYVNVVNPYYTINNSHGVYCLSWHPNIENNIAIERSYPVFADSVIVNSLTGEVIEPVERSSDVIVTNPKWPQLPDDRHYPVIPYLKLPFNPNWIDPVTGLPGGGNWGFNLADLLDKLEDLARLLIDIGALGELINQFSQQSGDVYYITYNEGDVYNYEYYTIANYGDDIYNVSIDVSNADEELPVDLNTISVYTNNRYLTQIKESAIAGSSMLRDLAVFWHDVDPEITYIVLGCCILVLIGAFTGKLGHS